MLTTLVLGYAATRSDQQQNYDALAHAPASLQYPGSQAQVPHGTLDAEQLPFIPGQHYEAARDASGYQAPEFPLIDRQAQQMPEITLCGLPTYSSGSRIFIQIQSRSDLLANPPPFVFTVMLGNQRLPATLSLEGHDPLHTFSLVADASTFQNTAWSSPEVPLSLEMWDHAGRGFTLEAGSISYSNVEGYQIQSTSPALARKRKVSPETGAYTRSPAKRPSTQQLRTRAREDPGAYESTPSSASPSSPFVTPGASAPYSYAGNFTRPQQQQLQLRSSQQSPYQYPTSDVSHAVTETQTPSISTSNGSYTPGTIRTGRTAPIPTTPSSSRRPEPTSGAANPPLIRTSTIQPSASSSMQGSLPTQGFNPYAMYPSNSKAVLKIEGDLDKMSDDWTDEEWEVSRRLVQFTRKQNGSVIHTSFQPVTLEERAANSICISCIWWEEKQECFVTSVDTIYLLESLVGVRFTVEEKNRIRRNLEGFRPATVSKAKQDSEEFFKIIMGFPNPKPRNIEKDVKVFPWRILAHALKKIIGKYSASYSSTAGALPPAAGRGYGSSSGSSGLGAGTLSVSPRSRSASHGYTSSMPTISTSAGPAETQFHPAVPADFRAGIGSMVPSHLDTASGHEQPTYEIQMQQQQQPPQVFRHHRQHQHQQQPPPSRQTSVAYTNFLDSTGRTSWDLSGYMDPSPVTATPGGAAQVLQQQYEGSVAPSMPTQGSGPAATPGETAQSTGYHRMTGYHGSPGV
ncbi:MAG: hypothetical protein Q9165_004555 [Trypethelium subeluteriae]